MKGCIIVREKKEGEICCKKKKKIAKGFCFLVCLIVKRNIFIYIFVLVVLVLLLLLLVLSVTEKYIYFLFSPVINLFVS